MFNIYGETPLHSKCQKGHLKIMKLLLETNSCKPAIKDDTGKTALDYISFVDKKKIILKKIEANLLDEELPGSHSDNED